MKRNEKQNTTVGEAHLPETAVREQSPQDQLATFARDILRLCGEARRLTSDAIDRDREAGEVCLQAKAACKEADVPWEPWCEEYLDTIGGLRTVQRLMRVAKNWNRIERERKKTPDLTTTAALRLLANARRKGRERTMGAAPEPQGPEPEQQPAGQTTDQMPRLRVSRSRAEDTARKLGLDPGLAVAYLQHMFIAAGFLAKLVDD
jgi:hypothetical protein